jgi:hypothetical protein
VRVGGDVSTGLEGGWDAPSMGISSLPRLVEGCGVEVFVFRGFRVYGSLGCPYISLCLFCAVLTDVWEYYW